VHVPVGCCSASLRRHCIADSTQTSRRWSCILALAKLRSILAVVATHCMRTTAATSAQQWRVLLPLAGMHRATAAGMLRVRAGGSGFVPPTIVCWRGKTSSGRSQCRHRGAPPPCAAPTAAAYLLLTTHGVHGAGEGALRIQLTWRRCGGGNAL
jgi:hypothetical protein